MPTYGTKVPYKGHICALSGAMIQKNLLGTLILIPDTMPITDEAGQFRANNDVVIEIRGFILWYKF